MCHTEQHNCRDTAELKLCDADILCALLYVQKKRHYEIPEA